MLAPPVPAKIGAGGSLQTPTENAMNKLQRLTEEIRNLSSGELAVLRAWFEDFDSIDSRRRIDAYLPDAEKGGAGDKSDNGAKGRTDEKSQGVTDDRAEDSPSGSDQRRAMEMAASLREAYRQVAFQEYAQLVANDLGLGDMLGHSRA